MSESKPWRCSCGTIHTTHHDGATVRCPHCDQECPVLNCGRCKQAFRAMRKRDREILP